MTSPQSHGEEWTPEMVGDVLANPVYTGVGPYPRIVSDEDFIAVGVRMISETGAEAYLQRLLTMLRSSLEAAK